MDESEGHSFADSSQAFDDGASPNPFSSPNHRRVRSRASSSFVRSSPASSEDAGRNNPPPLASFAAESVLSSSRSHVMPSTIPTSVSLKLYHLVAWLPTTIILAAVATVAVILYWDIAKVAASSWLNVFLPSNEAQIFVKAAWGAQSAVLSLIEKSSARCFNNTVPSLVLLSAHNNVSLVASSSC